nr:MAG TPA: hypothetical protein [Caudoviricetes sp.]
MRYPNFRIIRIVRFFMMLKNYPRNCCHSYLYFRKSFVKQR